jgi:hypothetical protein
MPIRLLVEIQIEEVLQNHQAQLVVEQRKIKVEVEVQNEV